MKTKTLLIPTIFLTACLTACNLSFLDKMIGVSIIDDESEEEISESESESESYSSSSYVQTGLVTAIDLSNTELTLKDWQSIQLTATVYPSNAKNKTVTWSVDDMHVATITADGYLSAVAPGNTNVICSANDASGVSSICELTVIEDGSSAIVKATQKYTYTDVDSKQYVSSTGNQKVLVVPTYFSDEPLNATPSNRDFIRKSFFGSNDECGWRSFTGYYEEASYEKLHYSGHVSNEWYDCGYTTSQVIANRDLSKTIASNALKWFKEQNPYFDWTSYDANEDGTVDSLYIIYASDYINNESPLWGYRWSTNVPAGDEGLQASAFSWFSLKFLNDIDSYGGVPVGGSNTRIIIHEHGHMLGLADYYDNAYSGIDLVGGWDMQDRNQFDWNAFSKYSVGWTQPYFIRQNKLQKMGSDTVTIRASAENGDCILVHNDSWNGSPFDEYLLLELFNPEIGNNEYDYKYSNSAHIDETGFGVKVYHVDARMARYYFDAGTASIKSEAVDSITKSSRYTYFIPNDNDNISSATHNYIGKQVGFTEYENYHLLQLIQKEGVDTFSSTDPMDRHEWKQSDLFQTGDTFCIGNHDGFTDYGQEFFYHKTSFNDGTELPYGITFDSVTKDSATITFTYLG